MKPQILFLIAFMFLVLPISAYENIPSIKQGETVTLRQTCGSCTYVNLSVYYPNSIKAVDNQAMTNVGGGYWEYTFTNTSLLGRYDYPTCGDIEGVHKCTDKAPYFEVTPSGKDGVNNIIFFIFIIVAFYAVTLIGFFGKNIPITILGGMAMTFLGIYLIQNGIIIYRDTLTLYFSYLTIGLGAVLGLWALIEWIEETL